jgi:hypothetical protein
VATINSAKTKYRQKLPYMTENYMEGVAGFLGISEGAVRNSAPGQAYAGKMQPGIEDKWERGLREAFGA